MTKKKILMCAKVYSDMIQYHGYKFDDVPSAFKDETEKELKRRNIWEQEDQKNEPVFEIIETTEADKKALEEKIEENEKKRKSSPDTSETIASSEKTGESVLETAK